MSARSGWTTPRKRQWRRVAQFREIRIRARRRVGALALDRVQADQRPVGPLRLGRRDAKFALHRVCAKRWNAGFRERLARMTVRCSVSQVIGRPAKSSPPTQHYRRTTGESEWMDLARQFLNRGDISQE